ncbi:polyketide synthase dehydratase domain-containing protein, partial [Allosalinactinospora lopnorensis]|uniref:polyketide synthase dehydratase domain-containing protein n=1 Tax=Allosalinactinospora lopnorensis TaxID=1352348 RepID=UPI000B0FBF49
LTTTGLEPAGHPLLGAAVAVPDSGGVVLTGRLSVQGHPWLADHVVGGSVLFPGTGFVELAACAGDRVGCDRVEELELGSALVLPEHGGVQLRVVVGAPDEAGRHPLSVYSRPEEDMTEQSWVLNASGVLAREETPEGTGPAAWPPDGASPVEVEGLYEWAVERGYEYGPVFQGLRAAWRRGEDLFAEVALPESVRGDAAGFGLHPALLDAALHALLLDEQGGESGETLIPFVWSGVSLYATGASVLRVQLSPAGDNAVALAVADKAGRPVASVERLVTKPATGEWFGAARTRPEDSLFRVEWGPTPAPGGPDTRWVLVGAADSEDGETEAAGTAYRDLASLGEAIDAGMPAPDAVFVECLPTRIPVRRGCGRPPTMCWGSSSSGWGTSGSPGRGWSY